jgi:hypothetical protein
MKIKTAIDQFRLILHDLYGNYEYDNYHCLMRLNSAVQLTCNLLVQINSPLIIREEEFENGGTLPGNFLKTCGIYPIRRTGNVVQFLDDVDKMVIRYYVTMPKMESGDVEDGDMPFEHDTINDFVIRTACKLALNRNEFDISQDQGILTELQNSAAEAMSNG